MVGGPYAAAVTNFFLDHGIFQEYRISVVRDEGAANCLFLNNTLVRRASTEFPNSAEVWNSVGGNQIEIEAGELAKVDGALTCCSLLIEWKIAGFVLIHKVWVNMNLSIDLLRLI